MCTLSSFPAGSPLVSEAEAMWHEVFDVWYQVTFDELSDHIRGCSDELWLASMWDVAKDPARPQALGPDGQPHPLGNDVLSAVWKIAWHGLLANEFNLNGRRTDFRTTFRPASSWDFPEGIGGDGKEVLPLHPPSREELLAYLEHNRQLANRRLDTAREVGAGQATLGNWSGPTSILLSMFHGNACHLVSHATEVGMFVHQHR